MVFQQHLMLKNWLASRKQNEADDSEKEAN